MVPVPVYQSMHCLLVIILRTVCTNALLPDALARARARSPSFWRLTTSWPSCSLVRFSEDIMEEGRNS